MKATNHPSDKMTIKNNNGDLLLEIDAEGVEEIKFKNGSKYTGAEIDAAVGKADTVPNVTAADAGKALVVDEEGKIVTGEAGAMGTITILLEDIPTTMAALSTFMATINDNIWHYKAFLLSDAEKATIKNKFEAAYAVNKNIAKTYFAGNLPVLTTFADSALEGRTDLWSVNMPDPISKRFIGMFFVNIKEQYNIFEVYLCQYTTT